MTRPGALLSFGFLLFCTTARADVPYWQYRSGGLGPFVRSIAVDPTDANVVYAAISNAATYYGDFVEELALGVFRSTDGGANWTLRNTGLGSLLLVALAIDPQTPQVLYAGTDDAGVFKTVNGGSSWTAANAGLGGLAVYALAVDPQTPTTVYAGLEDDGIYRSLDGGASWSPTSLTSLTVWAFAIDPVTPSTLYAATTGGVWKSTNGGVQWTRTGPLTIPNPGGNTSSQANEAFSLVIDATAPSTVLAGTQAGGGVFRSTDGGTSWTHSSTGLRSEFGNWAFITALAQDPITPSTFYATSTRSTYRSIDGGTTWVPFNAGLARGEGYALGVHSGGTIYTGTVFAEFHRLATRPSGVDHFRCFKAKARGFAPRTVPVVDGFGTTTVTLVRPSRFCTPTAPGGESVVDPTTHLVCYRIASAAAAEQFVPLLVNRFDGYRGYSVRQSDTLCVPASIDGVPSAAPRDAYRCLRGRAYGVPFFELPLSDGFGTQVLAGTKEDRACAPTDLDGSGENRLEPGVGLRCDKTIGQKPAFSPVSVTASDRFGTVSLTVQKPDSHCFPSLDSRF